MATVNVFSWGIFWAGGLLWAFDISGVQEMRDRLRVRLGLSSDEQKGGQQIVGQWIEAAKPWKAFRHSGSGDETDKTVKSDIVAEGQTRAEPLQEASSTIAQPSQLPSREG